MRDATFCTWPSPRRRSRGRARRSRSSSRPPDRRQQPHQGGHHRLRQPGPRGRDASGSNTQDTHRSWRRATSTRTGPMPPSPRSRRADTRPDAFEDYRRDPRTEGRRRRAHRDARSLAQPDGDRRDRRRQGHLLREAGVEHRRSGRSRCATPHASRTASFRSARSSAAGITSWRPRSCSTRTTSARRSVTCQMSPPGGGGGGGGADHATVDSGADARRSPFRRVSTGTCSRARLPASHSSRPARLARLVRLRRRQASRTGACTWSTSWRGS